MKRAACLALGLALGACGGPPRAVAPAPAPSASAATSAAAPADPLGPRPEPAPAAPFAPPAPVVLDGPHGAKLWLFERHALPLVSLAVITPYGSAAEPAARAGLAHVTADMLDEGAGKRDAVAWSSAVAELGATIASSADRDASVVTLSALSSKIAPAIELLRDAIVAPRHDARDWARVRSLEENALRARATDANEIARVVTSAVLFGESHPYGHPTDGTLRSTAKIGLADVAAWHRKVWRPDVVTFVVVGDVTADGAKKLLGDAFAAWKAPATAAPPVVVPPPPAEGGFRTAIVDRPDAPQVVMTLVREGVAASDPARASLALVDLALGGSFTSRLNQSLREEHGWTYGARTRFNVQRGVGAFVARAAIRTDAIGPALAETRAILDAVARGGIAAEELDKARAQLQATTVERYASVSGVLASLASNAALGLAPSADADELAAQRAATLPALADLARAHVAMDRGVVLLVGPKDAARAALEASHLPPAALYDADGAKLAP